MGKQDFRDAYKKSQSFTDVADTFRVRAMVRDVAKIIVQRDGGKESNAELADAILQKHSTIGNDVQASRELESWGDDAFRFILNIVQSEF